jgi:predicted flavoprotein YhiN
VVDLLPDRAEAAIAELLARPAGGKSLANRLRGRLRLDAAKAALLREGADPEALRDPARLAARIKALPVVLVAPRPLEEAISTAGGVALDELDDRLMLRRLPGVFCAGEMLDWEAPTGGYLLTACLASGHVAGVGAAAHLEAR